MIAQIKTYIVGPRTATRLEIFDAFYSALGSAPTWNCAIEEVDKDDVVTELLPRISVQMTVDEWRNWSAGGDTKTDEAYVLACVAPKIPGVVLA